MTIRFVLLVNKQGSTRIARYYDPEGIGSTMPPIERKILESEIVRQMIPKSSDVSKSTSIFQQGTYQVCYKRYASLYFVVGFDGDENELALLEWIHCLVESLDQIFKNVCELDILYHMDTVAQLLDDMLYNGQFVENNKEKTLESVVLTNRFQKTSSA